MGIKAATVLKQRPIHDANVPFRVSVLPCGGHETVCSMSPPNVPLCPERTRHNPLNKLVTMKGHQGRGVCGHVGLWGLWEAIAIDVRVRERVRLPGHL